MTAHVRYLFVHACAATNVFKHALIGVEEETQQSESSAAKPLKAMVVAATTMQEAVPNEARRAPVAQGVDGARTRP